MSNQIGRMVWVSAHVPEHLAHQDTEQPAGPTEGAELAELVFIAVHRLHQTHLVMVQVPAKPEEAAAVAHGIYYWLRKFAIAVGINVPLALLHGPLIAANGLGMIACLGLRRLSL
jgi:hypothetical protein